MQEFPETLTITLTRECFKGGNYLNTKDCAMVRACKQAIPGSYPTALGGSVMFWDKLLYRRPYIEYQYDADIYEQILYDGYVTPLIEPVQVVLTRV